APEHGGRTGQRARAALQDARARPSAGAGGRGEQAGRRRPEPPAGRGARQEMARATADLEDPIAVTWRQKLPDATDPLALNPAHEGARVVVEPIEIVLLHHRVVPRLNLGAVPERPHCHDHYAITSPTSVAHIRPSGWQGSTPSPSPGMAIWTITVETYLWGKVRYDAQGTCSRAPRWIPHSLNRPPPPRSFPSWSRSSGAHTP